MPRGVYHSALSRGNLRSDQGKTVSGIPSFMLKTYEKNKQPGLKPGLAGTDMFNSVLWVIIERLKFLQLMHVCHIEVKFFAQCIILFVQLNVFNKHICVLIGWFQLGFSSVMTFLFRLTKMDVQSTASLSAEGGVINKCQPPLFMRYLLAWTCLGE